MAWLACYRLAGAWRGSAERMRCYQHSASPDVARTVCRLLFLRSRCGGGPRGDAGMMRVWRQPRAAALCCAPAVPASFVFPLPLIPCFPFSLLHHLLATLLPLAPRLTTRQPRWPHCYCVSRNELLLLLWALAPPTHRQYCASSATLPGDHDLYVKLGLPGLPCVPLDSRCCAPQTKCRRWWTAPHSAP